MSAEFRTHRVWPRITKYAKKAQRSQVAVAYLGKGAAERLPVRRGSVVVTDFSLHAIRSGQTNPREVLKLINTGVHVHSVQNLHAKVFVLGDRVIVDSSNASTSSANTLIEAVVETTSPNLLAQARRFISNLMGDEIGPAYAGKMIAEFREPIGGGGGKGNGPVHSVLWLVPLVIGDWGEEAHAAADSGRTVAKKRRTTRNSKLDEFLWTDFGDKFFRDAKPGERILQIVEEDDGRRFVYPLVASCTNDASSSEAGLISSRSSRFHPTCGEKTGGASSSSLEVSSRTCRSCAIDPSQ